MPHNMSWMKNVFGGKSSSKSSSKSSRNTSTTTRKNDPSDFGMTPEELADAERTLPVLAGRGDRLSVSKSGRHKYKGKQRLNLQDDTYATHGSMGAPRQPTSTAAASSSSSYGRATPSNRPAATSSAYNPAPSTSSRHHGASSSSTHATRSSQGSVGRNSQQGSLGRSGASNNCAVSSDVKRYNNARQGKNMQPRTQTAV